MSAADFKKQLWEINDKLTVLKNKRDVASNSLQVTSGARADVFVQKKELKNQEYIKFLEKEQEATILATERKIADLQSALESKKKYYSDKIAALKFSDVIPPPPPPSATLNKIAAEIDELEHKKTYLEKTIPMIEAIENEETIKEMERLRQVTRRNVEYAITEEKLKARAAETEQEEYRKLLAFEKELQIQQEEEERLLKQLELEEDPELVARDREEAKQELEELERKKKAKKPKINRVKLLPKAGKT